MHMYICLTHTENYSHTKEEVNHKYNTHRYTPSTLSNGQFTVYTHTPTMYCTDK